MPWPLVGPDHLAPSPMPLYVAYNEATDLYDLQGFRYNRRTLECPEVLSQPGVYAEDLKRTCENTTGLAFSL
jgi:hypothetical protein